MCIVTVNTPVKGGVLIAQWSLGHGIWVLSRAELPEATPPNCRCETNSVRVCAVSTQELPVYPHTPSPEVFARLRAIVDEQLQLDSSQRLSFLSLAVLGRIVCATTTQRNIQKYDLVALVYGVKHRRILAAVHG